jgi:protein-tyrosine phosphatase
VTIEPFAIHAVTLPGGGEIGLCRLPGRSGDLAGDCAAMARWSPQIVVSLTEAAELAAHGAARLGQVLSGMGIRHVPFPILDFGAPELGDPAWHGLAPELHAVLDAGGRVLLHCMGGCGRSGMIALRLMVERGEVAEVALRRLRAVRTCAVETDGQLAWAVAAHHQPAVRPK